MKSVRNHLKFYFITDSNLLAKMTFFDFVSEILQGGVTAIQLREKNKNTKEFYELARQLKLLIKPKGIPLIINDRLDIALAVDADGIHVGQNDLSPTIIRKQLGQKKIIGLSISNHADLNCSCLNQVDYLGIGPIFETTTKTDAAKPTGLSFIQEVQNKTKLPLVAIGGINLNNIKSVLKFKVDGVAIASALTQSQNPKSEAGKILKVINEFQEVKL
jgi:thiamine-phosphate pyrophosphorylase